MDQGGAGRGCSSERLGSDGYALGPDPGNDGDRPGPNIFARGGAWILNSNFKKKACTSQSGRGRPRGGPGPDWAGNISFIHSKRPRPFPPGSRNARSKILGPGKTKTRDRKNWAQNARSKQFWGPSLGPGKQKRAVETCLGPGKTKTRGRKMFGPRKNKNARSKNFLGPRLCKACPGRLDVGFSFLGLGFSFWF